MIFTELSIVKVLTLIDYKNAGNWGEKEFQHSRLYLKKKEKFSLIFNKSVNFG